VKVQYNKSETGSRRKWTILCRILGKKDKRRRIIPTWWIWSNYSL